MKQALDITSIVDRNKTLLKYREEADFKLISVVSARTQTYAAIECIK